MAPGRPPVGRAFLVGCPRSGTTLLQSLIAAHPDAISLPETFFFARIAPSGRRGRLGLAPRTAPAVLADLDALGLAADPAPGRLPLLTVHRYARRFTRRMDQAAREANASLWLEKTPRHARHIDLIEREVPRVRFVHIVRAGEAVVASLQEASEHDPVVWPPMTPLEAAQMWQRYLGYTTACVERAGHAFVAYERLVAAPAEVMRPLCGFLGLRDDNAALDAVLSGYRASAAGVTGRARRVGHETGTAVAEEPWKHDVGGEISNRNDAKFRRRFSEAEQAEISAVVAQRRDAVAALPFL
jgi:hypothetical protein